MTSPSAEAMLLPQHAALVSASGISPEVATARGYRSVTTRAELRRYGFSEAQCRVPALLIPIWGVAGEIVIYQSRPDQPRIRDGKPVKYETLIGSHMALDVPPMARAWIGDPKRPLFITEGARKADAAVSRGLCCVDLLGVWNWRGTNEHGGKIALPDWESIALNGRPTCIVFDSDVMEKREVYDALARLKTFLESRGADCRIIYLPPGEGGTKQGLDDFFAAGCPVEDLLALATRQLREPPREDEVPPSSFAGPISRIRLGNRRLSEKTADALEALKAVNAGKPRIFQQGGVLVRLRLDGEAPRVEALIPDAMRGELDRVALWMQTPDRFADPPMSIVRDILSLPSYDGFPHLRAVAEAPFFTREGRLVVTPGYHEDAATFLHLPSTLGVPAVLAAPSNDDVRRATALFYELFTDFPFVDDAGPAHAIGLAVLPFVRGMIDGPTPSHALDSPMPGTGKGLLADLVSLIATGHPIEVMTEAKDNEELRKRITAVLLSGTSFGLFDNITRRLDSAVLSAALTATTWSDRVLGLSKMVRLPIRITWIITGNNLSFSREMARRAVHIRLDARSPEPQLRTGFKHDPIHEWVRGHRGELVRAALVMVQNWIAQGQPQFTKSRMGSYESWAGVVGGILAAAGVKGFLENLSTFSARANAESAEWGRFVTAWWGEHAEKAVDTGALFPLADAALPEVLGDGSERSQRIRLGKALAKRVGWTFAINPTGDRDKVVVRLDEAEVVDADRRKRNGWALNRLEGGVNIGTLGKTLGNVEIVDLFELPNVQSQCPNVDPSLVPLELLEEVDLS